MAEVGPPNRCGLQGNLPPFTLSLDGAWLASSSFPDGDMIGLDHQVCKQLPSISKSSEMPIDDLLDLCTVPIRPSFFTTSSLSYTNCYMASDSRSSLAAGSADNTNETTYSSSEDEILSNQDLTLDKDEIARDLLLSRGEGHDRETSVSDLITVLDMPTSQPDVSCSAPFPQQSVSIAEVATTRNLVNEDENNSNDKDEYDDVDDYDNDDDSSSSDDDGWPKSISVGADYQADLPDLITLSGDHPERAVDERLLWDPSGLAEPEVDAYCCSVVGCQQRFLSDCSASSYQGNQECIRDNEEALKLLMQCNYDTSAALQRLQVDSTGPQSDPLSCWSADECANFVSGLRQYGKDFYLIHQNKVRTRSVSEIVQFYYLWKRTDQYAAYNFKMSAERRRFSYSSYESILDDAVTSRDMSMFERPPSPGIHTLLYADAKRHDHHMGITASSLEAVSTPTMHSVTPPSWMLSPLPHLATYPRHQSIAHFDPVVDSYSVPYPVEHLSVVPYARTHYCTDSVTGYANSISDSCYFAPYHGTVCAPLDYGVSVLEPPIKKLCSGSVVVDSSPLHAMAPVEYVSPPVNSSIIYAPPTFSADTSSMYSCRQMSMSSCVTANRPCREPVSTNSLSTSDVNSSCYAAVVTSEMLAQ